MARAKSKAAGAEPAGEWRTMNSLLAVTGGGLDAVVYLNHGHVFAAAMTGNSIFLGIALLAHNRHDVLLHMLPIVFFVLGVLGARVLGARLKRHAVTVGLACEIVALFVAAWLPKSFPEVLFVPLVALAAAYQVASFRTVDTYAFNSTFITGNLRTAMDGLYEMFSAETRKAGRAKFRELSLIIASFTAGALTGAVMAPRFYNYSLLMLDVPLLAVLVMVVRGRAKTRPYKGAILRSRIR